MKSITYIVLISHNKLWKDGNLFSLIKDILYLTISYLTMLRCRGKSQGRRWLNWLLLKLIRSEMEGGIVVLKVAGLRGKYFQSQRNLKTGGIRSVIFGIRCWGGKISLSLRTEGLEYSLKCLQMSLSNMKQGLLWSRLYKLSNIWATNLYNLW